MCNAQIINNTASATSCGSATAAALCPASDALERATKRRRTHRQQKQQRKHETATFSLTEMFDAVVTSTSEDYELSFPTIQWESDDSGSEDNNDDDDDDELFFASPISSGMKRDRNSMIRSKSLKTDLSSLSSAFPSSVTARSMPILNQPIESSMRLSKVSFPPRYPEKLDVVVGVSKFPRKSPSPPPRFSSISKDRV